MKTTRASRLFARCIIVEERSSQPKARTFGPPITRPSETHTALPRLFPILTSRRIDMAGGIADLFDSYARQARLFPGRLTVFPPLTVVLAWFPMLLLSNLGTALLTLATSCGLLYALGSLARTLGKNVEARLLKEWGGWPTTINLRFSGPLERPTLTCYHGFLGRNVPGLTMPSEDEERANPGAADGVYASAVKWLKEETRKGFPRVDKENAQYGFRRNLRGMKPIGILSCVAAVVFSLVAIVGRPPAISLKRFCS